MNEMGEYSDFIEKWLNTEVYYCKQCGCEMERDHIFCCYDCEKKYYDEKDIDRHFTLSDFIQY